MLKEGYIKDFFLKGKEVEKRFLDSIEQSIKSTEASKNEDIYEHWDIKLSSDIKIDVKGIKRDSRHGEYNENIHWIEIKGVRDEGWLFGGKSDYICFETISYWIMVKRFVLIDFIKDKCKDKVKTDNPNDAIYKLYSRKGRNDILTKAKTIDLMFIADHIIKKS